jgi:hypothetical protein
MKKVPYLGATVPGDLAPGICTSLVLDNIIRDLVVTLGSTHPLKEISKILPQQTEVAQGAPGKLRLRVFLTLGTTWVVGRQPYAPAAFTSGEIPGTHF